MSKKAKPSLVGSDRDRIITYLLYALHDVENLSPESATYLKAAISELEHDAPDIDDDIGSKVSLN